MARTRCSDVAKDCHHPHAGALADAPRQSLGQDIPGSDRLILELNWVSFDVAMGRILATGNRTRQDRQRVCREHPNGLTETLTVTLDRGLVSMHYESVSETRQLTVRVVRRDQVEIESTRHEPASHATTCCSCSHPTATWS